MKVEWELPIRTVSEANCVEHWTKKHKRHKQQQFFVRHAFSQLKAPIPLPCVVTLTRIAPRALDEHDNLRMSLKWITDQVADCLIPGYPKGMADSDTRIKWQYRQEKTKGSLAVRIQIDHETPQEQADIQHV